MRISPGKEAGQFCNRGAGSGEVQGTAPKAGGADFRGFLELVSLLGDVQHQNRHFSGFAVQPELETIRQQCLKHGSVLCRRQNVPPRPLKDFGRSKELIPVQHNLNSGTLLFRRRRGNHELTAIASNLVRSAKRQGKQGAGSSQTQDVSPLGFHLHQ